MPGKKFGFLESAMMRFTKRKATPDKETEKYEAALKQNPNNVEALNALGDICARHNDNEKAHDYYVKAGRLFAQDGFTLKAIAVYKKAQRAKPDSAETCVELANLYVQKGFVRDAKDNYLVAAELLNRVGSSKASLDIYKKVVDLDPSNINLRLKLADLYKKGDFLTEAAALYLDVAKNYISDGMLHESAELYKMILELQPEEVNIAFELASLYFDLQMVEEGIQILENIQFHYPNQPPILEKIGEIYTQIGKPAKAIDVYQSLVELDPSNEGYRNKLSLLTHSDQPLQKSPQDATEFTQIPEEELQALNFGEEPSTLELAETRDQFTEPVPQTEQATPQFESSFSSEEIDMPEGVSFTEAASEQAPSSLPPKQADSGYFDLAARLDSSLKISHEYEIKRPESSLDSKIQIKVESTSPALTDDVGDVIKEFKKSVLDEVGEEDYETHYELGVAYKEMNLLDDAIEEFKLASLSPNKYIESCNMIGLCFAEKGEYDQAIAQLKEGLEKSGYDPEQYLSLRYGLALIYEAATQPDQALDLYKEIYRSNPNYMDVAQRLTELRQ